MPRPDTRHADSAVQDGQALLLRSLAVSAVATGHGAGTHPPQQGAGIQGAAALAVTGPPLSRWTQRRARRFALYWFRAATRACPAASTTSVDDARTATLRPGSSTSSSTSPTAALPGPRVGPERDDPRLHAGRPRDRLAHRVDEPGARTLRLHLVPGPGERHAGARPVLRTPGVRDVIELPAADGSVIRCPLMSSEARYKSSKS